MFIDKFYMLFKEKSLRNLYIWINEANKSNFTLLKSFAKGLLKDIYAVHNAVIYSYSNEVLEGNITRLKMIKIQMYGRAKFDLIRQKYYTKYRKIWIYTINTIIPIFSPKVKKNHKNTHLSYIIIRH